MNIYLKGYRRDEEHDDEPQLGLGWYRHHSSHPYKGFSIFVNLVKYRLSIDFVNDWKAYEATYSVRGFGLFSLFLKRREGKIKADWKKSEMAPFIKAAKKTPLKNKDNI